MSETKQQNRPSEVIYQIYPSSFHDADGDGHGDLKGITAKLDYIKSLHVDAIWISPFFLSPEGKEGDGGYAITDYRKIGNKFGTDDDFDVLLKEAHKRGLRVYTDFVMCHTSHEHDWFQKSRDKVAGYENRYVWHDGKMEGGNRLPPNNWKSVFGGSAWSFDDKRKQYYLRHFNSSQPALNLNDPATQDAIIGKPFTPGDDFNAVIKDTEKRSEMQFWLDKGVDGLRLDALPFANYDPQMRDNPWMGEHDSNDERWGRQYMQHSMCQPATVNLVGKIRKMLDSYPTKKSAIGEVIAGREGGGNSMHVAKEYLDPKTGLDTCYTEGLIRFWYQYPTAGRLKHMIRESMELSPDGGFCNNPSNHDFPRAATRMTADAPQELRGTIVRQLMALNVALPGSLCIFQGEELGLPQARIPEDIPLDERKDLVDERCRDGARTPPPWDSTKTNAGFSTSNNPYLPVAAAHYSRAVNLQEQEAESMLNFTRELLEERKLNPALSIGNTRVLDTPEPILAIVRETDEQTVLLAFNMSREKVSFKPSDYLDADTLGKLKIAPGATMRIGEYGYEQHGLNGHFLAHEEPMPKLLPFPANDDPESEPGLDVKDAKVKKLFAVDMLITDNLLPAAKLPSLIGEYDLESGQKRMIDEALHERLLRANKPQDTTFGGATAITLWTLKKMMGDKVDISIMGLAADDAFGPIVKDALKKAKIKLLTEQWPPDEEQKNAVSHVISYDNGHNTILTYPGTGPVALRTLLKQPENSDLLEKSIRDSDIVYLPGSLTEKFSQTLTDEVLRLRWIHKKELVLALPTHANYGATDAQTFRGLLPSANVVIGSDTEFCRICDISAQRPVTDEQLDKVVEEIQAAFCCKTLEKWNMPCPKEQVALITRADKPALLVTAYKVKPIDPVNIGEEKTRLGAGDAATAGFLTGYIKGMDHYHSAHLAMAMAAEKVGQDNAHPHLIDPKRSLDKILLRKSTNGLTAAYNAPSPDMPVIATRA